MMNLDFTEQENAFRAECRSWLEANVPKHSLPSGDTREGYALHLEWERKLFDAGYVTVTPDARFEVSRRLRDDFDNGRVLCLFEPPRGF